MAARRQILVVDDEPAIARLVRAKLTIDGFQVTTAASGEACLAMLEDERPDLIVLDLMMPGIDGFETLRRIRQIAPIPVIMLTARTGDSDTVRGLQSGADDYITKPLIRTNFRPGFRRFSGGRPEPERFPVRGCCAIPALRLIWTSGWFACMERMCA